MVELDARLERLLGFRPPQGERLRALERLLERWGRAVDLTGFDTEAERDRRYFGEALSALRWLPERGRALDIGSGGGSPALPLAVVRPAVAWTLVESNAKKAMFLKEAMRELGLASAVVVSERYERFRPEAPVDVITVRGVAVTDTMLEKAASELRPGGRLLWFSSQARLAEAGPRLQGAWRYREGPVQLVTGGGFLGLFEPSR